MVVQKTSWSPYPLSKLLQAFLVLISSRYVSQVFPCLQQVSSKSFVTSSFTKVLNFCGRSENVLVSISSFQTPSSLSCLDLFSVCLSGLSLPPASLQQVFRHFVFHKVLNFCGRSLLLCLRQFLKSLSSLSCPALFCQTISLRVSSVVWDLAVFPEFRFQCCSQGHRFVTRAHKYGELRRIPANFGELWRTLAFTTLGFDWCLWITLQKIEVPFIFCGPCK